MRDIRSKCREKKYLVLRIHAYLVLVNFYKIIIIIRLMDIGGRSNSTRLSRQAGIIEEKRRGRGVSIWDYRREEEVVDLKYQW